MDKGGGTRPGRSVLAAHDGDDDDVSRGYLLAATASNNQQLLGQWGRLQQLTSVLNFIKDLIASHLVNFFLWN